MRGFVEVITVVDLGVCSVLKKVSDGARTSFCFGKNIWRVFTTKNSSLPSNKIWGIVIDGENRKWFGTKKGIATLLNDEWALFNKKNTPLKTNLIRSITFDDYDRVWVGTEKNITSYDGEKWKKHKMTNKQTFVTNMFIDSFDNKWICTPKNVFVYNDDGVEFKENTITNNSFIVSK